MAKIKEIEGIPLKAFEEMTIGKIKELDKQFKGRKILPGKKVKFVKDYGKKTKL